MTKKSKAYENVVSIRSKSLEETVEAFYNVVGDPDIEGLVVIVLNHDGSVFATHSDVTETEVIGLLERCKFAVLVDAEFGQDED